MATSSLYKTFYITEKNAAKNFVALLDDSLKNPPLPRNIVKTKRISDSEWEKLSYATIQSKR